MLVGEMESLWNRRAIKQDWIRQLRNHRLSWLTGLQKVDKPKLRNLKAKLRN